MRDKQEGVGIRGEMKSNDINNYARAELYSARNIRHYYRYSKGLDKVDDFRPPWTGQYESCTPKEWFETTGKEWTRKAIEKKFSRVDSFLDPHPAAAGAV